MRLTSLNRLCSRLASERGQSIMFFAAIFTVIVVMLAIVVDVGMAYAQKRAAQKDVDAAALAGAHELAKDLRAAPGGPEDRAWAVAGQGTAAELLDENGATIDTLIEPAPPSCPAHDSLGDSGTDAFICADTSCFAGSGDIGLIDSITVDAQGRSDTPIASAFGVDFMEVGAHAKACVGSLVATTGLRPWSISRMCSDCFDWIDDGDGVEEDTDTYIPRFGEDCVFRSDGKTETESAAEPRCVGESRSQVGSIRLGPDADDKCWEGSGGDDYRENIIGGADSGCRIDDVISTEPGFKTGPTKQGLKALLADEGQCDSLFGNHNGIDDFGEAFSPADAEPSQYVVYTPNACTTPRVVNIVIMDEFDGNGIDHQPIRGFAAFYILQCEVVNPKNGKITAYPKCDMGGSDFQIRGRFMQKVQLEGTGGALDPYGTRVVFLSE